MLKHILLAVLVFASSQVHAARITDFGQISHKNDLGVVEFNISQESNVQLWEISIDDYRISLFDEFGLIASNDDNMLNWFYDVYSEGMFPDVKHSNQNKFDASLLATTLLGDYTVVISYWNNAGILGDTFNEAFDIGMSSAMNRYVGNYELNIEGDYVSLGHQVSAVPAPPAVWLMLSALPGIFYASKRNKKISSNMSVAV